MSVSFKQNISVKEAQYAAQTILKEAEIISFKIDARVLLKNILQQPDGWILTNSHFLLSNDQKKQYEDAIERRLKREPVEKICGVKEFWSLPFMVSKDVLTPRPDSETLIALTLDVIFDKKKPLRILDLGIGSGCLLLTLLKELPYATGVGVDINFDSLQVAQKNIKMLAEKICSPTPLDERIHLIQGNWGRALTASFDIVISNPPYICRGIIQTLSDEVQLYEPLMALNGGVSGLDCYKEILSQMDVLLKKEGIVILEAGYQQMPDILKIIDNNGLKKIKIMADLQNIPRAVAAAHKNSPC